MMFRNTKILIFSLFSIHYTADSEKCTRECDIIIYIEFYIWMGLFSCYKMSIHVTFYRCKIRMQIYWKKIVHWNNHWTCNMLSKIIFKYDAIFFIKNSFFQIGTSCTVQQLYFIHIYVGTISAYTFIVNYLNLNCQANNSIILCSFILYYWSNKGHIYN